MAAIAQLSLSSAALSSHSSRDFEFSKNAPRRKDFGSGRRDFAGDQSRRAAPPPIGAAKRKWKDPFLFNEEDPDLVWGNLFTEGGRQPEQEYIPPLDPKSKSGFRKVPKGYTAEIRPLAAKVRDEVRKCLCLVAGGVYENLLFFPVIELLKDRYPGVEIDVIASERGKQVYEMNKNVSRAWVFDIDQQFIKPALYMEMLTMVKNEYYDMIVSTKLAGIGHALFMWLTDCTKNIGYIYPDVNGAGAGPFLYAAVDAPRLNLAEGGYHMYHELNEELGKPAKGIPRIYPPQLTVGISSRLRGVILKKWTEASLRRGEFIVIHGIESDSAATMKSRGDSDSLLPVSRWSLIAKSLSKVPVFVIPHEKERSKVEEVIGPDAHIIFITTPGQLAALINDSFGVITTNTAALQLAISVKKPTVALFSSDEKAKLFVPNHATSCDCIASDTGKLLDVSMEKVKNAINKMVSIRERKDDLVKTVI
ncbi:photosynthetic NDH subunit of subcomplex B 1, chloroplastic isoform X2 [Selaginella moellendorffii]|uniref:photosynthetic NDH subunit of subcomplex B 1, chloroplastic isoform X2 n=1 Tax=Selaginella moellendorffii TaxID=88036 RepID=UPI000D1C277B|nr:photosynthetic NDH subunit of subcomplex B 1, chloroplastic isoform X2 [Selaginella moellendorffii]|eukprot:XP_024543566.1 photosynthetic NDH subunit of subcomplex B 1, chloroplastic isoform X2 [Selaginella moellendorffii]